MSAAAVAPSPVGQPVNRVDGRLKVTGEARYAAEFHQPNLAHAVLVQSTIAQGRIKNIYSSAAEKAPGVLTVITHTNATKLKQPKNDFMDGGFMQEDRFSLDTDEIAYAGQHIAVVVADSFENAMHAAALIRVEYETGKHLLTMDEAGGHPTLPEEFFHEPIQIHKGDVTAALTATDAIKIEATYVTPTETHNPMEPSATIAMWEGDRLTVYDATQWVQGTQATLAEAFGLPRENVRVICPFVGGAFGCKGFQWPHTFLAAMAARQVRRPVKLAITRPQMFTSCGHRPVTVQDLALAADKEGKLRAIRHRTKIVTSPVGTHIEACGLASTGKLYACPNIDIEHTLYQINIATPTPMRAPGETPGTYALESAMDELAYALKLDPIALRLVNYADAHPISGKPWSSKQLKECYRRGAEKFGWSQRKAEPRSTRGNDGALIGWGMATATYPGYRFAGAAKARLMADGRAVVSSAAHDLGTGAYTVFTQVAAEAFGLPVEKINFKLGDSSLPKAPVAGGSNTTATISEAILRAAAVVKEKLAALAVTDRKSPLFGQRADNLIAVDGRLSSKSDPSKSDKFADILSRAGQDAVEGESGLTEPGEEAEKFAFQSFGAHFCEVKIDPLLPRVRVTRFVSVIDNGRVLNPKTSRSQIMGGVIMGIGMALMEETIYDPHTGRPVTQNLADYHVCVNADVADITPFFIDVPDPHINSLGARGLGEIGITGVAAAVANAIFHATGKRVRDLPITPDKLI
jgi:xanthine dehydrogenase YagR molybdenum-binding subunit